MEILQSCISQSVSLIEDPRDTHDLKQGKLVSQSDKSEFEMIGDENFLEI